MTAKSRVRPHLPVIDATCPPDPNDKGKADFCDRCGLRIVDGDPRHTVPEGPRDDARTRAAGEERP